MIEVLTSLAAVSNTAMFLVEGRGVLIYFPHQFESPYASRNPRLHDSDDYAGLEVLRQVVSDEDALVASRISFC